MVRTIELEEIQRVLGDRKLVIFGYGRAGKRVSKLIDNLFENIDYCFCDNDVSKQNSESKVYEVAKIAKISAIYVITFVKDNKEKTESAIDCLKSWGVSEDCIYIVPYDSYDGRFQGLELLKAYIDNRLAMRVEANIEKIDRIVFVSAYYDGTIKKCGGPVAALMMQKELLEHNDDRIEMIFPTSPIPDNKNVIDYSSDIVYKVTFAAGVGLKQAELYGSSSLFVSNDMWDALGLLLAGKRYSLIHHAQGDLVCEYLMWGEKLSDSEISYLRDLEKLVVENAVQVRFPSRGAELYFRKTYGREIAFKSQEPLYNTIYDYSAPKEVDYIAKRSDVITFFSIGQFTKLKGMDRIPTFLEGYISRTGKKIRWIVVASGVLKDEIKRELDRIKITFRDKFEFLMLDPDFSRDQIYYLFTISDIYIMLHRISIFDFSTLEAMYMGKGIILSDIDGNNEFNKDNNILLVDPDNYRWEKIIKYVSEIDGYGMHNKKIYYDFFSEIPFKRNYMQFVKEIMEYV